MIGIDSFDTIEQLQNYMMKNIKELCLTGTEFDIESEVWALMDMLRAPLIEHKEKMDRLFPQR